MIAWLYVQALRILYKFDPAWGICGGCDEEDCDDCG